VFTLLLIEKFDSMTSIRSQFTHFSWGGLSIENHLGMAKGKCEDE
jgi:hypothetical protein